jgi:hypothetical protein
MTRRLFAPMRAERLVGIEAGAVAAGAAAGAIAVGKGLVVSALAAGTAGGSAILGKPLGGAAFAGLSAAAAASLAKLLQGAAQGAAQAQGSLPPSAGATITTLTLTPSATGTLPYVGAVYPLEGEVPSGYTLASDADTTLRGSVLSTWPDGSAQVVVLAGERSVTSGVAQQIALKAAVPAGAALTPARISALITSVAVNVPGVGSFTLSDFSTPLRTWWANERVICASYRLPIGSGMVAIAYVQAFASPSTRALVEVVVENGEVNAGAATVTAPTVKNYSGATVAVNGSTIATVNSPTAGQALVGRQPAGAGTWSGGHEAGRAWYASTWVGGNPQIEVTHDAAHLQQHPWYWKITEAPTYSMQTRYNAAYDTYAPWSVGRLRTPGMANGGDDDQLALLPGEQTDYMASGDRYARRAVVATGLAMLSMGWNWRHTDGTVPQRSQYLGKSSSEGGAGTWPASTNEPRWGGSTFDGSHIPATTITAFLCQPSPVFIEIAQREGIWNHTNYGSTSGVHGYDQIRSRAWRVRNYAIATFLTPDADTTRKADWRTVLEAVADYNAGFFSPAWNTLQCLWTMGNGSVSAESKGNLPDFDIPAFQHWFLVMAWNAVDKTKVARTTGATKWATIADTISKMPVRMVNESSDGTWRVQHIDTYAGVRASDGSQLTQPANWYAAHSYWYGGMVGQPRAGTFVNPETSYSQAPANGYYYDSIFMSALAVAVERGVTGADTAWQYVYTDNGISNYQTWRQQYRTTTSRFNRFPRNKTDTKALTALGTAAAALASNAFSTITGTNITATSAHPDSGLDTSWFEDGRPPGAVTMLGYYGKGCYDPTTRRALWMSSGYSTSGNSNLDSSGRRWNTMPTYTESSNQWSAVRGFRAADETDTTNALGHGYDSNCIDVTGRRLYKYKNYHGGIYVHNLDTGAFLSTIAPPGGLNSNNWWPPMEFIPTRGTSGALWLWAWPSGEGGNGALYEYQIGGSGWTQIVGLASFSGTMSDPDYGPVMSYNPRAFSGAGAVFMAGSNGARIVRCDTLAVSNPGFGPGTPDMGGGYNSGFCRDPVGDGWIQMHNSSGRVWRYSSANGWQNRAALPGFLSAGTPRNFVVIPIDAYGVVWAISWGAGSRSVDAAIYKP